MYITEADLREQRTRRIAYILFSISMIVSVGICSVILFFILAPKQGKRLVGRETAFTVGQVEEVMVDRLELSELMPNTPDWSEDVVFVIKRSDESYQAFLGFDPVTGCKINWRTTQQHFIDGCSQTTYTMTGRDAKGITTLESQPRQMVELPVETENGEVYVLDQRLRRDIR